MTAVEVVRSGEPKREPFTIAIVANPALEAPWSSGQFVADPIMGRRSAFQACVKYIDAALFGALANQAERLLGDPAIGPKVRVVAVFDPSQPVGPASALVAQDGLSNLLVARRSVLVPFLASYGIMADVAYAVSGSMSHTRASAWFTSDDDARPGVPFTLDGVRMHHRFYNVIPGAIALHATSTALTALHEFQHALSSYTNGRIVDLYVDSPPAVNCKQRRPIPPTFAHYDGGVHRSDPSRNSLGYPQTWQSYHCELIAAAFPAVMDDYWQSSAGPELCMNDTITRRFILDRVRAKLAR